MTSHTRMGRRVFLAAGVAGAASRWVHADGRPSAEVPWLADVVDCGPLSLTARARARRLLTDDQGRTIASRRAWTARRGKLLETWRTWLGMDHLPRRPEQRKLETLSTDEVDGVVRRRVRYETLPGEFTEAYWLEPRRPADDARPGAVVFHSTVNHSIRQPAGVEGVPEKAFGLALAKRGFTTFCPRNFLWPTNDRIDAKRQASSFLARYPGAKGMARMLWESQLAVDCLCRLPGVDTGRIGAIGHSLGAKEVLYLAAFDERVKSSVSSEGGVGFDFTNWDAPWYLGSEIRRGAVPRTHDELLAIAAPRPFLLVGGDSADGKRSRPHIQAAQAVYRLWNEPVRLGLYNHGQGHSVPKAVMLRMIEWLATYSAGGSR